MADGNRTTPRVPLADVPQAFATIEAILGSEVTVVRASTVDEALAREAFALAAAKLPLRTTFVHRMIG